MQVIASKRIVTVATSDVGVYAFLHCLSHISSSMANGIVGHAENVDEATNEETPLFVITHARFPTSILQNPCTRPP